MTITLLAPDGVSVTAKQERQARAAQHGGGAGRPLGGRSGFRVDTPASVFTATSTTWTLGPCSAWIDPGASTTQGMYGWASDANIQGSITPADQTNARKDIVYIQVNDSTAGDGSGEVTYAPKYLAGPMDGTNKAPALPARSFLVGTIDVPKVGAGAPTATLNPAKYVAAGAPLPVSSQAERDALSTFDGLTVRRMDIPGRPTERFDGSLWYREGVGVHLEISRTATANSANTLWGPGVPAELTAGIDAAASRNPGLFTFPANNQIAVTQAGIYSPSWAVTDFSAGATGYILIRKVSTNQVIASKQMTATGDISVERGSITLAAGETLQFNFQTNAAVSCKHLINLTKIG